jgi:hypothetical protein
MELANELLVETDEAIRSRFPPTGKELELFRKIFVDKSWEEACALLGKVRDINLDGLPGIEFCALLFHKGIVFDRDDAIALSILKRGGESYKAMRREIKNGRGAYTKGCISQAREDWKGAVAEFQRGIREEKCVLCLVQLGVMLVQGRHLVEGLRLLKLGAEKGDVKAMFNIALASTVQSEAVEFLEMAAQLGHKGAHAMKKMWNDCPIEK